MTNLADGVWFLKGAASKKWAVIEFMPILAAFTAGATAKLNLCSVIEILIVLTVMAAVRYELNLPKVLFLVIFETIGVCLGVNFLKVSGPLAIWLPWVAITLPIIYGIYLVGTNQSDPRKRVTAWILSSLVGLALLVAIKLLYAMH